MIDSVKFTNFRVLRDTRLPLGPFTLIVGPNGSGKSTALIALRAVTDPHGFDHAHLVTKSLDTQEGQPAVQIIIQWGEPYSGSTTEVTWSRARTREHRLGPGATQKDLENELTRISFFSFEASRLIEPVPLKSNMELGSRGEGLAGVIDRLRDNMPERWDRLNEEVARWFPEYDHILFDTDNSGRRTVALRTRTGQNRIPARDLSQGTLFGLAFLTLSHIDIPPAVLCIEEPDHGIHPRLFREIQDALYRLAYPDQFGDSRNPVQVIVTTHSPYFLDLYRDHPEEIVIANKDGLEARFERLKDRPDVEEILEGAPLGEVWYSGVLGGVPTEQ